jgi:two-component system chemotaxis response regulator CheB
MTARMPATLSTPEQAAAAAAAARARGVALVVLGGSAGGVQALLALLHPLPAGYPLPIVALLHMPEDRSSRLPEVFGYRLALPVVEARDKEPIAPATVYFAPPGYHLSIEHDRSFSLSGEDHVWFSRPSIDVLMASVADVYGAQAVGILLTGASVDGAAGLGEIKRAGGLAVVQDPAQAQVPTMPQAAIDHTPPDLVLALNDIHALLLTLGSST